MNASYMTEAQDYRYLPLVSFPFTLLVSTEIPDERMALLIFVVNLCYYKIFELCNSKVISDVKCHQMFPDAFFLTIS